MVVLCFVPPPPTPPIPCRDLDFGVPTALCNQTASGVFSRPWSNAVVTLDCNTFTADLGL